MSCRYPDRAWIRVDRCLPRKGVFVETKIDDERGCRNEQQLKLDGRLWFTDDGMYVYYTPTHWRDVE